MVIYHRIKADTIVRDVILKYAIKMPDKDFSELCLQLDNLSLTTLYGRLNDTINFASSVPITFNRYITMYGNKFIRYIEGNL